MKVIAFEFSKGMASTFRKGGIDSIINKLDFPNEIKDSILQLIASDENWRTNEDIIKILQEYKNWVYYESPKSKVFNVVSSFSTIKRDPGFIYFTSTDEKSGIIPCIINIFEIPDNASCWRINWVSSKEIVVAYKIATNGQLIQI